MPSPLHRLRENFKASLDRRYMTRDELTALRQELRAITTGLAQRDEELNALTGTVEDLTRLASTIEELHSEIRLVGERVNRLESEEGPNRARLDELADQVREASRLATESAQAIEGILQRELLLRRDLDARSLAD